ncbi:pR121 [rat cytomegalovirus strain Maastricht]|uniref:PR121 n=1 Tax=Rat cytomegalovirus (strain Maastricht) TaxID=79700 RepID=Q9DW74_RCMVM|nr:pR121 [rat cytomegalovirus strain Maastricht]AAF99216.1 pR121 [rat cytomegalovirus strain Maastricht]
MDKMILLVLMPFIWAPVLTWNTFNWNVTIWAEIMSGDNVTVGIVGRGYSSDYKGDNCHRTVEQRNKSSHIKCGNSSATYNVTPTDVQLLGSWSPVSESNGSLQCIQKRIRKPVELRWLISNLSDETGNYTNEPLNITIFGNGHRHRCLLCYFILTVEVFICVQGKTTSSPRRYQNFEVRLEEIRDPNRRATELLKYLHFKQYGIHATPSIFNDARHDSETQQPTSNGSSKKQEKEQKEQKRTLSRSRRRRDSIVPGNEESYFHDPTPYPNKSPGTPPSAISTHNDLYTDGTEIRDVRKCGNSVPRTDASRSIPDYRSSHPGSRLAAWMDLRHLYRPQTWGVLRSVYDPTRAITAPDDSDDDSAVTIMLSPSHDGSRSQEMTTLHQLLQQRMNLNLIQQIRNIQNVYTDGPTDSRDTTMTNVPRRTHQVEQNKEAVSPHERKDTSPPSSPSLTPNTGSETLSEGAKNEKMRRQSRRKRPPQQVRQLPRDQQHIQEQDGALVIQNLYTQAESQPRESQPRELMSQRSVTLNPHPE